MKRNETSVSFGARMTFTSPVSRSSYVLFLLPIFVLSVGGGIGICVLPRYI